jgi:ankyrin repeat protein
MPNYFKYAAYTFVLSCVSCASTAPDVEFFRAVNVDNEGAVRALLKSGFDPNTRNPKGQAGLYLALRDDSPKVAALLMAHSAVQVDALSAADETPLMMAALRGNLETARRLLEMGAALNRTGWTPLHYAASGPAVKVVRYLLDQGAEIDAVSPNLSTPLMMAAGYGPQEAVELLLERGANAKARNGRGLSAADFARAGGREALAAKLDLCVR